VFKSEVKKKNPENIKRYLMPEVGKYDLFDMCLMMCGIK